MHAARLGFEQRPAARQQELASDRLDRDHIRVEREHERRGRQGRGVQLDDLLALPGPNLPWAGEAAEGREVLVLNDDPERQLGPSREVAPDRRSASSARATTSSSSSRSRRAVVREGAEQQVETRQVVAVVPAADLQRQQGAERGSPGRSWLALTALSRVPPLCARTVALARVARRLRARRSPASAIALDSSSAASSVGWVAPVRLSRAARSPLVALRPQRVASAPRPTETTTNSRIAPIASTPTSVRSLPDTCCSAWSGPTTCCALIL